MAEAGPAQPVQGRDYVFSMTFSEPVEEHLEYVRASLGKIPCRLYQPCFADVLHRVIAFEVRDISSPDDILSILHTQLSGLPTFHIHWMHPRAITSNPHYHLAIDPEKEWIALFPRSYHRKEDSNKESILFSLRLPDELRSRTKKDIRGALKNPVRAALADDADAIFEIDIDVAPSEDPECLFLCVLFRASLPKGYLARLKDPSYALKIPLKGQTLSIRPVPQPITKVEVGESSIPVSYEYGKSIKFTFERKDLEPISMEVRDQLQQLGFLNIQELDAEYLNHVGSDGYITNLIDAYENEHACLSDMSPASIASLGIANEVAYEISQAWDEVFASTRILFHGELDYTMFVRNYFLDKLLLTEIPLPDAVVSSHASGTIQKIKIAGHKQGVYVLHISEDEWSNCRDEPFQPLVDTLERHFKKDQFLRLYHGTSRRNCGRIISSGIQPNIGVGWQDFSNSLHRGYYCAYELSHAFTWAYRRNPYQPAVLVHAVPIAQLQELSTHDFDVLASPEWEQLVTSCRRDDQFPPMFDIPDCIQGPMCCNPNKVKDTSNPEVPRAHDPVMCQFCALSAGCAQLLTRSLVGIVFVPPAPRQVHRD